VAYRPFQPARTVLVLAGVTATPPPAWTTWWTSQASAPLADAAGYDMDIIPIVNPGYVHDLP